jgi:hypothetical protein
MGQKIVAIIMTIFMFSVCTILLMELRGLNQKKSYAASEARTRQEIMSVDTDATEVGAKVTGYEFYAGMQFADKIDEVAFREHRGRSAKYSGYDWTGGVPNTNILYNVDLDVTPFTDIYAPHSVKVDFN